MKRDTPSHPKVLALLKALDLSRKSIATVIGHLELLWHFTAKYAPRGDVGRFDNDYIEASLHWYGRRGRLIEALTTSGWLDAHHLCRLVVHDWHDHADDGVRKKLSRSHESFLSDTWKISGQRRDLSGTVGESVCQPLPTPSHAEPEPLPEPLPTPQVVRPHAEFPETARAIRESYPATDDIFVMRLCSEVQQKVLSATVPLRGDVDDFIIADAVRDCRKNSVKQNGPGLFSRTVPQCVLTWLTQGRTFKGDPPPISDRSKKSLEFGVMAERMLQNAKRG